MPSYGDASSRPRSPAETIAGDAAKGANPAAVKLGRNDPCYCGSGLKFKKCHGR